MITPTQDYRRTSLIVPRDVPSGADALVDGVLGRFRRRRGLLRGLQRDAKKVDRLAPMFRDLTDRQLRVKLSEARDMVARRDRDSERSLFPCLAAVREAAARQTGMRPFVVQLVGALALHRGYLAEMATGEGKTLVAGLAAVLAGWTRQPCHIITVNDYLAKRDADWFRPLYEFCRLSVGSVTGPMEPQDRAHAYAQDITYTTGKEILADFLRDRLRLGRLQNGARRHIRNVVCRRPPGSTEDGVVMRGLHTAIVDEADSILIDEAVTPLIISQSTPNETLRQACIAAHELAADLEPGTHFKIDTRYKEAELTDAGHQRVTEARAELSGIWRSARRWSELVEQALTAREFFQRGAQYVLQDESVVIVDEYTGRLMPQRTWRHGLHQAIEAKEDLEVSAPSETLSRLSFQRFFRFFHRLSGMTGTASESAGELWHMYRLPVVRIPTNRPCIRRMKPDRIYATEEQKWSAVVSAVTDMHATERPLLIGTRSVRASEALAARLRERGMEVNLLNAVHHEREASIIAEAGQGTRVTIATNMAGRGTDILLGPGVKRLGGLHVVATERHESRRIDRQLFGRSARQGDPGSAQALLSLDDELFVRFLPGQGVRNWLKGLLRVRHPGARLLSSLAVRYAQRAAQRQAYKQRQNVLRMDTWMDESLSFTDSSDRIV